MAVVTKYGTGYQNPTAIYARDSINAGAEQRAINSKIDIANGDSATSLFYLGKIPTNAIVSMLRSTMAYGAVTGASSFHVGFANDNDALVSAASIATAGNTTFQAANSGAAIGAAIANQGKRVWELAGLASDPGGELDVIGTLNAGATAASSVYFEIVYSRTV